MRRLVAAIYDDLDATEKEVLTEIATPGGGTTFVGLDGTWHELDLTAAHRKELEDILQRYISAGHKPTGPVRPSKNGTHHERVQTYAYNRGMRAWADKSKGRYTYRPMTNRNGRVTTYKYPDETREAYAAHLAATTTSA